MKDDRKFQRKPQTVLRNVETIENVKDKNREVIIREVKIMLRWKQTRRTTRKSRGRGIRNDTRR